MRSTTYRFCVDVCLPDRRWARASVPLWCILLLAGVVGFTRLSLSEVWLSLRLSLEATRDFTHVYSTLGQK